MAPFVSTIMRDSVGLRLRSRLPCRAIVASPVRISEPTITTIVRSPVTSIKLLAVRQQLLIFRLLFRRENLVGLFHLALEISAKIVDRSRRSSRDRF